MQSTYRNLELSGTVVRGDTAGDPGVPGGVQRFAPYVEDVYVRVGKEDITDMLTGEAFDECCDALLQEARY